MKLGPHEILPPYASEAAIRCSWEGLLGYVLGYFLIQKEKEKLIIQAGLCANKCNFLKSMTFILCRTVS